MPLRPLPSSLPRSLSHAALLLLPFTPAPLSAQTLLSFDASGPVVFETTGPAAGCGYPSGPLLLGIPAVGGLCPGPLPIPPGVPDGGIAHDPVTDTIYVSDGGIVASYTAAGAPLDSFPSPMVPCTGLAFDAAAGLLWLTDGVSLGAIVPPAGPGACFGPPPPVLAVPPPFLVPFGPIGFSGPLTDIDWDPATGSFWGCDAGGIVGQFTSPGFPGGLGIVGPLGVATPPLAPPLAGVCVDRSAPAGTVFVTNGLTVEYVTFPFALPAPPTFYASAPSFPHLPAPTTTGLAYTAHAITFGAPGAAPGFAGPPPAASASGNFHAGNPAFTLALTAPPGAVAFLMVSTTGTLCPGIPVAGSAALLVLPPLFLMPTVVVGPGGTGALTGAVPAAPGVPVDFQWLVADPGGTIGLTDGLHATIATP